ncbi:MAG: class I tRNA ligase family protein, partial [Patescibacteria group bacterium]
VMQGENVFFKDNEVKDVYNKVFNLLSNVVEFYKMNADLTSTAKSQKSDNVLDKWILTKLHLLVQEVTENMDAYNTVKAGRPIKEFIDELSTWYVRRSRDRFKEEGVDRDMASATLHDVLLTLSKVMAPFTPFIAEKIYQEVGHEKESVHLEDWPDVDKKLIDQDVLAVMHLARSFVTVALMQRAQHGIKVRQPLSKLSIKHSANPLLYWDQVKGIIADEVNVKEVILDPTMTQDGPGILLDVTITPELKKEGLLREITRAINQMRKNKKLTVSDTITITYRTEDSLLQEVLAEYGAELKKQVLAQEIREGDGGEEALIDERKIWLTIS